MPGFVIITSLIYLFEIFSFKTILNVYCQQGQMPINISVEQIYRSNRGRGLSQLSIQNVVGGGGLFRHSFSSITVSVTYLNVFNVTVLVGSRCTWFACT